MYPKNILMCGLGVSKIMIDYALHAYDNYYYYYYKWFAFPAF